MTQGFKSEEARKAFLMRVGIWSIAAFIGQIIVPMILMMAIMLPLMMGTMMVGIQSYRFDDAQPCGDSVIIVKDRESMRGQGPQSVVQVSPQGERELFAPAERAWLAGDGQEVWCLTRHALHHYRNGIWHESTNTVSFCAVHAVTAHQGVLYVQHSTPEGITNVTMVRDGEWKPCINMSIPDAWQEKSLLEQHIATPSGTWQFKRYNNELCARRGTSSEWARVAAANHRSAWHAMVINGAPGIILLPNEPGSASAVYRFDGTQWGLLSVTGLPAMVANVVFIDGTNALRFYTCTMPWQVNVYEFAGTTCTRIAAIGGGTFPMMMPTAFIGFAFIPHVFGLVMPVLLALIFSRLIRRYRAPDYICECGDVAYASLLQRSGAALIDAAIPFIPVVGVVLVLHPWTNMLDIESYGADIPFHLLATVFGIIFTLCGFGLASFLLFSFFEGHYGWTPGKLIVGIRVVSSDTLQPCGFGRGLLRNLLRFVDAFFNYLVGLIVAALTEHRQRVGDMAARTIVIRKQR